jgi:uncharacterized membrane protein
VELGSYKIISTIQETAVSEKVIITIINDGHTELKSAAFSVPGHMEVLSVEDSYGPIDFQATGQQVKSISMEFNVPVKPFEERLLVLKLRSDALVTEKDGYFEYLLVFTPRQNITNFEHLLKLPKKAELFSPGESFDMVVPPAEQTDAYETPALFWRMDLPPNQPVVFLVRYRADVSKPLEWLLLVLGVGALVVFGYVAGMRAKTIYTRKKKIESLKILNEKERRVVEEIARNEGIKQYELLERLGYTKASLSKILTRLEQRDLVTKKKYGKVNRLYLGEKLQ